MLHSVIISLELRLLFLCWLIVFPLKQRAAGFLTVSFFFQVKPETWFKITKLDCFI